MPKLLVVDDDPAILQCFQYAIDPGQATLLTASTVAEATAAFQEAGPDVVITDIRLSGASGLDLLRSLRTLDSRVPVILMTGCGTSNTAIDAMRSGAFDYLLKPLDLESLETVLDRAFEASRMARTPARISCDDGVESFDDDLLIGQCPAMQEIYRQIGRVAGQDVTVLILGESGTGKEVVARAIYQYSQRAEKPFLAINCAAIPENLLESELFGHEKGSFSGAERQRIGKFEQCDGGTLFLDEIGDMTPLTQTKVLRVLQDQQFERVGGNQLVRTNVRLIAATNRNLAEMMQLGTFRNDLFYRLNVYTIHLPPLRERIGDLPLLIKYFLNRFNHELDKQVERVSPKAMALLMDYQWPGNIRELQCVLKHAVVEAVGPTILPEFLPDLKPGVVPHGGTATPCLNGSDSANKDPLVQFIHDQMRQGTEQLYEDVIRNVERMLLPEVLNQVDHNLSRASAILGITRSTIRSKLANLGITLDRTVRVGD